MPNSIAIIQARMGSSRLPGKVMKPLLGHTILAHDVARIRQAKRLNGIVIATTTEPADDAIAAEAARLGVQHFRGSETDVLARYYGAAVAASADVVVRITSDCPLYDANLLDEMLQQFDAELCDYLSNFTPRVYPRGLDTEIFTVAALERAHAQATQPHEREHVTPYMREHPELFRLRGYAEGADHSQHRWTLDTPEDWALIEAIYTRLYPTNPLFSTADILALLAREPQLVALNAHIEQKKVG